jgi:hypothetical protein
MAKAETTIPGKEAEEITIRIEEQLPTYLTDNLTRDLNEYAEFYDSQAKMLLEALICALPGGTIDRFLARLLIYKATHFKVAYKVEKDG